MKFPGDTLPSLVSVILFLTPSRSSGIGARVGVGSCSGQEKEAPEDNLKTRPSEGPNVKMKNPKFSQQVLRCKVRAEAGAKLKYKEMSRLWSRRGSDNRVGEKLRGP